MIEEATKLMWDALLSKDFKIFCLNRKFTFTSYDWTDVYQRMTEPFEFQVKYFTKPWYYWWWRGIPAYTQRTVNEDIIYVNSRMRFTPKSLAPILGHEIAHLKGFSHGSNNSRQVGYWDSVPCQVQKFLKNMGAPHSEARV